MKEKSKEKLLKDYEEIKRLRKIGLTIRKIQSYGFSNQTISHALYGEPIRKSKK